MSTAIRIFSCCCRHWMPCPICCPPSGLCVTGCARRPLAYPRHWQQSRPGSDLLEFDLRHARKIQLLRKSEMPGDIQNPIASPDGSTALPAISEGEDSCHTITLAGDVMH